MTVHERAEEAYRGVVTGREGLVDGLELSL